MASNSSAISDPDFNESADWIEIYNASATPADIAGYYFTDNLNDPTKWQIPEGSFIPANGFIVFWADGEDSGLHTNFKLSSAGEEIGFFDSDINPIDELIYETQETDISYGRESDGNETWSYFLESTPEESNNGSTAFEGITYYEPFFSVEGGFYSTVQNLVLSSLGGTIHYTVDGREPTILDPIYTSGIEFDQSSFIRAKVFEANFIPGPTVTHSYFFDDTFATRGLPVFSLVTDPDFFWDDEIGLYVQDFKPEWEHPLNVEFFENDGNNQAAFNERAGVKINGQNSWVLPQKMLGIYFRGEYGAGKLDYPLFHDRERSVFDDFILRAGGSDWASTLFRDGLSQELVQENAPVDHQGFRSSIVFINGEYMGVHNIRSRTNDGYVEENYSLESGTYDLIENDGEVAEGNDVQFIQMDALFNEDLSIQENFDALAEFVDIENYTDYWITEIWSSNSSWGHNVKLWKPHSDGKWKFIFGDLDRSFSGSTNDAISEFSDPEGGNWYDYARIWMEHMFQNEDYRKYFSQRFTDHLYTSFHAVRVNEYIDKFEGTLLPEISYHVERWSGTTSDYGDGIETVNFWEDEVLELRDFASERPVFLMNDLQNTFDLDTYSNFNLSNSTEDAGVIILNNFKVPDLPWIGPYFNQMPLILTASPNPGYEFVGWSNSGYSNLISIEEAWKYNDSGQNLGTEWKEADYVDSDWDSGIAEFGYGDGDENTVISYGPDDNDKHITTYFRKEFIYTGSEEILNCSLNLKRDDGAVVYLNGEEIARSNMPNGNIDYLTEASETISGDDEEVFINSLIESSLVNGINVMAVEIHQFEAESSDISFDLSFGLESSSNDIISTELQLDVTLTGDTGFTANYEPTGECILPDEITENTTLTIDCSPYLASVNTKVFPNVTLTIEPGVEIWFPEEARLIIEGNMNVNGTEDLPVTFKENSSYEAESWGNVTFQNSTGLNYLDFLEVRNATEGTHPVHDKAAISVWFSTVIMDGCNLTENFGNPIYAEYSDIILLRSTIHSDITGDLINVKYGDALIDDCVFQGNDQPDTDAIDYDEVIDGVIRRTSISGFLGSNSDGIDLGEQSENVLIELCFIDDCTDKGISIGQSSTAIVENTTIVNCSQGLGIKDLGEAEIDHSTFYSNVTAIAAFEKNPGFGGGIVSVTNSIISNSSLSPYFVDDLSSGTAENNFYDTDTMPNPSNLWMNPLFENPTFYDFGLQSNSPALGSGTDGEHMGNLFHMFTSEPEIMISDIQYFHPVDGEIEFVKILNVGIETVDLSGYSVSGGIEFIFPEGIVIAPNEKMLLVRDLLLFPDEIGSIYQWDSGQLANEGELLILSNNYGIVIDHVDFHPAEPWPQVGEENEYISLISPDLDNHFGTSWETLPTGVGIDEHTLNSEFYIYPNPANDVVYFSSSFIVETADVYDVTGKLLISSSNLASGSQVNVSVLPAGVYLAVINGNQKVRFVKN